MDIDMVANIPCTKEDTLNIIVKMYDDCDVIPIILNKYSVIKDELMSTFRKWFLIPGMTVGIAYTAIGFMKVCIDKNEECDTLVKCISHCILMAGIFLTNVTPEERKRLNEEACAC